MSLGFSDAVLWMVAFAFGWVCGFLFGREQGR